MRCDTLHNSQTLATPCSKRGRRRGNCLVPLVTTLIPEALIDFARSPLSPRLGRLSADTKNPSKAGSEDVVGSTTGPHPAFNHRTVWHGSR